MRKQANKAVRKRIKELAPGASAEDLVKLADALGKLEHGPAGGAMNYDYNAEILNRHPRSRPGRGFPMKSERPWRPRKRARRRRKPDRQYHDLWERKIILRDLGRLTEPVGVAQIRKEYPLRYDERYLRAALKRLRDEGWVTGHDSRWGLWEITYAGRVLAA